MGITDHILNVSAYMFNNRPHITNHGVQTHANGAHHGKISTHGSKAKFHRNSSKLSVNGHGHHADGNGKGKKGKNNQYNLELAENVSTTDLLRKFKTDDLDIQLYNGS